MNANLTSPLTSPLITARLRAFALLCCLGLSQLQGCAAVATSMIANAATSPDLWASLLAPRGLGGPYREATEFYKKSDWKGLETRAARGLSENPISTDWMVLKSYALVLQNKFDEPVALMQRANELSPEDINVMNLWATALRGLVSSGAPGKSVNAERAINVLEKASRIDTTSAATYYLLGQSYAEQKRWTQANQAFEDAVRLAPDSSLVWFSAGQAYKAQGDLDKFSAAIEALRAIDPEQAQALAR
jgi:tetratricopeptide (TPR) repeat protein